MTTDEVIERLKALDVDDEQAEEFRDFRIQGQQGSHLSVVAVNREDRVVLVDAVITGPDQGWLPEWEAVYGRQE